MADLIEIKQSACYAQDTEGNPVVQLSPQNWERLIARIESETKHQNLLRTLLQEWAEEQDLLIVLPPSLNGAPAVRAPNGLPGKSAQPQQPQAAPARHKPRRTRLENLLRGYAHAFLQSYRWSIVPLIVIAILLVNNRVNYDTFRGYDMPQHFSNVSSIMRTGTMPPKEEGGAYEAHQAPLFYVLAAWATIVGDALFGQGFHKFTTVLLLPLAFAWVSLLAVMIQKMLRRVHPLLRAGVLCVVALFPMNIQAMTMFSNDLPVTLFGALAAFVMWLMIRSGRQLDIRMWLRAAAISGLAIVFKNNGVILLGTYGLLACYIIWRYLSRRQLKLARRVFVYSAVGVPLMLIPWVLGAWHTSHYFGDPFGAIGTPRTLNDFRNWGFFLSFDTSFFEHPWAFGPGEGSYWSLQYVTLHNDYYNMWTSLAYSSWPAASMRSGVLHDIVPIERFNTAILLQYLAIPITLVMVFGFLFSLHRVIFRPWYALRDGSVLVVIFAVVTQVAQIVRFVRYPDIRMVIIHARFMAFLYPVLFIIGIMWLWKLSSGKLVWQTWGRRVMVQLSSAACIAYTAIAFKLMWLPSI